ncbi:hypothetical protein BDV97DRAFT_395090 [Delphinella strobiligena]|nr:hypothetical protein BDV97DRAFT_395090 [Delphinella strobiligena]
MGIDNKRPPLPAPTDDPTDESVVQAGHMDSMDSGTDVATNVSRRTDATSYTVPEDGRPLVIPTEKRAQRLSHGRNKSQTSLLIEYFEGSKNGTNGSRPSVRVKVTPSSKRKNKASSSDAVQITGIGKDRKPSYSRRISLGSKQTDREGNAHPIEGTEVSHSSESNVSGRPPVEVEILNHGSDLSNNNPRLSRDLQYMTNPSDISSMPPESLLDDSRMSERPHSPLIVEQEAKAAIDEHLQAPDARERSRSISRERITQKVMEKLKQRAEKPVEYEPDNKPTKERRRRSSRTHHGEVSVTNTESSVVSSSLTPSQTSYRSGATSKVSLNNPRLLEMVEDTVRRLILPEIDQLKNEKRVRRNLRDLDDNRRESYGESRDSYSEDMSRRLSKSSSSPNMTSKPKVVLNRYDDNPGEVLSRGDSERKKSRRSSREPVPRSERSERRSSKSERERSVNEESKESHRLRDAAAAGVAGGILTAAALRHHDSRDGESREKCRKRRSSKSRDSRSRSASIAENNEEVHRKEDIPPMPFASAINESDVTRTSILSHATERPASRHSEDTHTPVREVSRGSLGSGTLPGSRTPTQNVTRESKSPSTPRSISNKARIAASAAAGLGGIEMQKKVEDEHLAETYKTPHSRSLASPAHSVSSVKDNMRNPLNPQGLRPRSRHSYASPIDNKRHSVQSDDSAREAEHELEEHLRPISENTYDDPGTPQGEDMEEWFQKQHEENERYRHSLAGSSVLDSVDERRQTRYTDDTYSSGDTSPDRDVRGVGIQPQYVHTPHGVESAVASLLEPSMVSSSVRSSTNTGKSEDVQYQDRIAESLREINQGSSAPHKIEAIGKAEEEPPSPVKSHWTALREQAALALSEQNSSNASGRLSPRQSETTSPVEMGASGLPLAHDPMPEIGHGLDNVSEVSTNPPEIQGIKGKGRRERWSYDSEGFLKDRQSRDSISQKSGHGGEDALLGASLGAAAGALAAEHAHAGRYQGTSSRDISHRPSVVDDYNHRPTPGVHEAEAVYMDRPGANSPAGIHGDEGYSSAAHPRSPGGSIAKGGSGREFTKKQLAEYEAAMGPDDDMSSGAGKKHARHFSANSHGLASPPYDSATGKGIDRIQSEDIVALMDHLTVRDGQRNARDTEILVTLVRSAAEMRQEFETMKKFIAEQDKMIMRNTDRDAELTVQKVLSGPRPMPGGAIAPARAPRISYDSEESYNPKHKSFFRRALRGFSSEKNNDIRDMCNHLLREVEAIREGQAIVVSRPPMSLRADSMDSYDDRPAGPDSGYEPEGQAGTGSTPNESGHLSLTPTREKHFHSGYDGRRGSMNRVSTVMEEGDEDDSYLDPHEAALLDNQFEGNERLTTPTQENFKRLSGGYGTPPRGHGAFAGNRELTPEQQTPEKQRKHKSNSSSMFNIPKLSRWSKTTSSSDPDYKRKSNQSYQSYQSRDSRSGDSLDRDGYYDGSYSLKSEDRLPSSQSRAQRQEGRERSTRSDRSSTLTRTPSPLVPSGNGASHHDHGKEPLMSGGAGGRSPVNELRRENLQQLEDDGDMDAVSFDDPKYQAHRNSLLLEHPQPRPGPTHRHQTNLENEARTFSGEMDVPSGLTNSDVSSKTADSDFDPAQWGSNPTLSLARTNKIAASEAKDEGPLIPQVQPSARQQQKEKEDAEAARRRELEREEERQSKQPRHAYDRMYYSSPLGSGHLLEPIPEVRYSLETNSIHSLRSEGRSPEPSARPSVATNGAAQAPSPARKITGPRPMGSRNASREEKTVDESSRNGTVKRKPVAGGRGHGM